MIKKFKSISNWTSSNSLMHFKEAPAHAIRSGVTRRISLLGCKGMEVNNSYKMSRSILNPIYHQDKQFFSWYVLLIAYTSTMLKQDLQSLVMAVSCSQVQRRPMMVERIHRNTLGQQQSCSIAVPWRYKEIHRMQKLQKETPKTLYIRPLRTISVTSYFFNEKFIL